MDRSKKIKKLRQYAIILSLLILAGATGYYITKLIENNTEDYQATYSVRAGDTFMIDLPGKVSVEYRWQINETKSKGLELLEVSHIGWVYPKEDQKPSKPTSFGAPRTAKFYIQTKAPGVSQIAFEYKKRGIIDDTPVKSRDITVNINP